MDATTIRYRDLAIRERDERQRLQNRLNQIDRTARSRLGGGGGNGQQEPVYLSEDERKERKLISDVLAVIDKRPSEWCDPLFVAVRDLFNARWALLGRKLGNPEGSIDSELPGVSLRSMKGANLVRAAAADCALTLGLLIVDRAEPPPVFVDKSDRPEAEGEPGDPDDAERDVEQHDPDPFAINANREHRAWAGMNRAFFAAVGEAQSQRELAVRVLLVLAREGGRFAANDENDTPVVDLAEFAQVMRELAKRGYDENTPQLGRKVTEALDRIQRVGQDDVVSEFGIGINLPDLEDQAANEIVADNVALMGPVICAAMLDELKAFQVVDRLVEMAQAGTLPIVGKGKAGELLYRRWKEAPNRISEQERRGIYAMTMGQPGGDPNANVNREFDDLWLRFVSSVSAFVRQADVDKLLRASLPSAIGQQQVRKAARDLASNLSLHGYGMTYYAALELQGEVKSMIKLLSDPEILGAFGAKDMWQVIDQVATFELGGARTSSRFRTLATCGAIITAWLAKNVGKIMRPVGQLIDLVEVRSPMPRTAGQKATSDPSDYDLVNACELWLADTATSDTRIEELAQPRETPVMTSKPVQIPAFAREFLDDLPGMSGMPGLGMGLNGRGARH